MEDNNASQKPEEPTEPQEPKEPTLEFTDKRRVHLPDEPANAEPVAAEPIVSKPEPQTPLEPTTTAPADEETAPNLPPLDVYGLLRTTVGLLSEGAWAWMGLTPNPFSGRMDRDLAQAKIAIDTVSFLVEQLDPRL
jgi:hypothetical protein